MNGIKYLSLKIGELELMIAQLLDQRAAETKRADEAEAKLKALEPDV